MEDLKVKCNNCGYVGLDSEFPKGRDFFQNPFISSCPQKCGNRQSPGGASMRMFGDKRPFEYVRDDKPEDTAGKVIHRSGEAS